MGRAGKGLVSRVELSLLLAPSFPTRVWPGERPAAHWVVGVGSLWLWETRDPGGTPQSLHYTGHSHSWQLAPLACSPICPLSTLRTESIQDSLCYFEGKSSSAFLKL